MITEERVEVMEIIDKTEEVIRIKTKGGHGRAILYRRLSPDTEVGDTVIVNTTAGRLNLGTGGWDIVRTVINKQSRNQTQVKVNDGHIMKARYLSEQHSVLAVEAPESKHHESFQKKLKLNNRLIFLGELHSMLPVVWFLFQRLSGDTPQPLAVVVSDEASLPLMMSRHMEYLHQQPDFHSITAGQAFGGKGESINVVTGLQHFVNQCHPDTPILITLGPGVVGSNTQYGFSGLSQASWANYIGALGGIPIWIPRLSSFESRTRHQGISHHTLTPLKEFTFVPSILPLPEGEYSNRWITPQIDTLKGYSHISVKRLDESVLLPLMEDVQSLSPFPLKTMGRTIDKDPLYFLGIAAAVCCFLKTVSDHSSTVS
ncbi:DUF3866 family protein [Evansella tamaricis]|uniref:DUF3866 family protein n=1 Tax=Evansella tamaricis TaxID=2069301 RepID=UPI001FEC2DD6|nr:DUF3866 family protein [Evansella tamaricis]